MDNHHSGNRYYSIVIYNIFQGNTAILPGVNFLAQRGTADLPPLFRQPPES